MYLYVRFHDGSQQGMDFENRRRKHKQIRGEYFGVSFDGLE